MQLEPVFHLISLGHFHSICSKSFWQTPSPSHGWSQRHNIYLIYLCPCTLFAASFAWELFACVSTSPIYYYYNTPYLTLLPVTAAELGPIFCHMDSLPSSDNLFISSCAKNCTDPIKPYNNVFMLLLYQLVVFSLFSILRRKQQSSFYTVHRVVREKLNFGLRVCRIFSCVK